MRLARADAAAAVALALGADEASQKAHQLLFSSLVWMDDVRSIEFATLFGDVVRGNFQMYTLWYKTNVAVFQPDIHGVPLTPIADFTFLEDVYREAR